MAVFSELTQQGTQELRLSARGGVTLQVRPFKNTPGNKGSDSIETQSADTTLTGRMGEWLPLGGVNEQFNRSQSSIGSYSSSQGSRKDSIWIRADLVK